MKQTSTIVALCLFVNVASAQALNSTVATTGSSALPASTPYAVLSRDANSAVWQRQAYELRPNGTVVTNIHRYVELATGLNHLVNGQYLPSTENITISADGSSAMAINGQHQVYFPGNIYSGVIKLVTPDGKVLRSQPIGLSYSDGTNSVLLAVGTNSTGAILSSGKQVIYTNAFAGLDADLFYTYTKAGFEQDVVLRQQPPDPVSLGLNSASTRLQMLTEFISTPQPNITANTVPTAAGAQEDDNLSFGAMTMGEGKAFLIGGNSSSVGMSKRWLKLNRRQFLIEEVPIATIAQAIDALPPFVGQASLGTKTVLSKNLVLPPPRLVHASPKTRFLAQATPPSQGLVLDYITMTSQTNWTFQGDTTYYLSGTVNLSGTNTFEGGAVIKYTNNASLRLIGNFRVPLVIHWSGGVYRPVVFTAMDDDSVGESIKNSSGHPTNYYANPALSIITGSGSYNITGFRIAYARQAVSLNNANARFYDGQIVNCQGGFSGASYIVQCYLRNVLFSHVQTNLDYLNWSTFDVQNATFDSSAYLTTINNTPYTSNTLSFTNCIIANVTNLLGTFFGGGGGSYQTSGGFNGFYNSPSFGTVQVTANVYPFQAAGAGSYYLTNGCVFNNAGTTSIDPVLLTNLPTRTTYPPLVYSSTDISTATTWAPRAPRDVGTPALGYHYDPLDYISDTVTVTNAQLTISNGTAIACYNEPGIVLRNGSSIVSVGTPLTPNWLVRYQSVQEQSVSLGGTNVSSGQNVSASPYGNVGPNGTFQFTHFASPAAGGWDFYHRGSSVFGSLTLQNDELWGGTNDFSGGTNSTTVTLNNNLFWRSPLFASNTSSQASLSLTNNLFWASSVTLSQPSNGLWSAFNNDFDTCTITNSTLTNGYNAYLNCVGRLYPIGTHDIVSGSSLAYQTSWFGTFYQPSSSPLIDKGNTTADQVGLYHFTTQTNQTVEGTSPVDIGYHYVATDQYGNLLDSNGDGIPDYLEDANGNGTYDSGDLGDWQNLNLNVIITRPRNGTILP